MNYIIVHNIGFEDFVQVARDYAAQEQGLAVSYVDNVNDAVGSHSNEWGCVRFPYALPVGAMFSLPASEYRYSPTDNAWLVGGQKTEHSDWVASLYEYFIEAPWGEL